ncbi:MAG: metallophosphoesterase [Thermoleophilaceae bacterium]
MPVDASGTPPPDTPGAKVRIAAAGDVHCNESTREKTTREFAEIDGTVDLILLAGDLTTHGEPDQARVLADACRELETPVVAVLGNHDWHVNRADELVAVLEDAGITMLDRSSVIKSVNGCDVGIVGVKGFVGGFPGCNMPDFGEPSLRAVYAETGDEVQALDDGLQEIATCPMRIALMHYAPTSETLEGEAHGIWAFLGTDRLAHPIAEHRPDLVLHGHAHAGTFQGDVAGVPVFNVSLPVMKRAFWVFEVAAAARPTTPIH